MINNYFESPSFWTLDAAGQADVRAYVDPDGVRKELDVQAIYKRRGSLASALVDAERRLEQVNPAIFPYLLDYQKQALEGELFLVFYQLAAQYKLDWVEQEWLLLPDRGDQLMLCAELINQLRGVGKKSPEEQLAYASASSPKHTKYLGLRLVVPILVDSMDALSSGTKKGARALVKGINVINERRLYWVWGGSTIRALLEILPGYLSNKSKASGVLDTISPITGSLSWILYFTRAGLEWAALGRHTISSFMGAQEKELTIPWQERFKTQWAMRKYQLLNDSIWGVCNLACFFVLVGSGLLGYWGNAFTALLLLMDVSLTIWRMAEEETEYHAKMARYQRDIEALEKQIKAIAPGEKADLLRDTLSGIHYAASQARLDWKYKQLTTSADLLYATSLLAAFCVLCCFFFPPAAIVPATGLILGVVGITLCFVFNLMYAGATMTIGVSKQRELKSAISMQLDQQAARFVVLAKTLDATYAFEERQRMICQLKQCYLSLKELSMTSHHQEQVIRHQRYQLIFSTLRDALFPPLFIASFLFMPLGVGIPLLVTLLAVSLVGYCYHSFNEPKKSPLPDFNQKAYDSFYAKALNHRPDELLAMLQGDTLTSRSSSSLFTQKATLVPLEKDMEFVPKP